MANNYSKCDELLDLWKNNKLQASPGCSIETTLEVCHLSTSPFYKF